MRHFALIGALLAASTPAAELFVATDGDDVAGDGSPSAPYASITTALRNAADGDLVTVRPGTYQGRQRLDGSFANGVRVRSEVPYQARLRHDGGAVVICFTGQGIIMEGFDIAHDPANTTALVIQIQDLLGDVAGSGDGSDPVVSRITLRGNIIHDSTNNDLLKVNNGAEDIRIEGNLFFNQAGSDEHIDVNSVRRVVVEDNIFMNTTPQTETSSFVVIKDSNGNDDSIIGAQDIRVSRNIFLNWQGSSGHGFVRVGEDGTADFEARDVLIENNLLLGNSPTIMRAAFTVMGSADVTIRHNTVSGDLPARAYAARLLAFGANQPNQGIRFSQNLLSDPTGTMGTEADSSANVYDALPEFNIDVAASRNLYFNGTDPIPVDSNHVINVNADSEAIIGDPLLPDPMSIPLPVWNGAAFGDGSRSVREAFVRLASFSVPSDAGPARDAGSGGPSLDLLAHRRDATPDIGAFEYIEDLSFGSGFE